MTKNNSAVEFINDEISHLPETGVYFNEEEEPDVFQRIRAFCDTSNASDTLALYRAVPNSKKEDFIINMDTIDFSPGFIKERFGGGSYIIKAYDDKSKVRLKQHLSIEGKPIINSGGALVAIPASSPPIDIQGIMHAMQESNRQLLTGLVQALAPQQGQSRTEMLAEMVTMREIFSPPQQNVADPMTMLLKGIELANSMAPKMGGETSGMDVLLESIKSFAPAIGAMAAQSAHSKNLPKPGQVVRRDIVPAIENSVENNQLNENQNKENDSMMMKYYLNMLIGFARENRDPSLYAELIADHLSDLQINELLSKSDAVAYLSEIVPAVNEYSQWFGAVISELRGIMSLTGDTVGDNVLDNSIKPVLDNAPLGANNSDPSINS